MFKGAYVRSGGELHFVALRNISESGICFDAFPGVEVGAEIAFCFDSAEPKAGVVKWVQDGRFGVSASTGGSLLPSQMGRRPRAVRLPLSITALVYVDRQCSEVTVHNISLRGVCVDHVFGSRVGQFVTIEIGGHNFELATIRWQRGGRVGICFAEPIQFRQFRELVKTLQGQHTGSAPSEPPKIEAQCQA